MDKITHEGKLADFVVLSGNPIEMAVEDLLGLTVDMTIIGGDVVYCAEGLEAMCDGVYQIDTSATSDSTTSVSSDSDPTSSMSASVPVFAPDLILIMILKAKKKMV